MNIGAAENSPAQRSLKKGKLLDVIAPKHN